MKKISRKKTEKINKMSGNLDLEADKLNTNGELGEKKTGA